MPDFGLAMSEVRNFGTLGAVGLVMREQPDLRGALARLIDFGWVQVDGLQLRLEEVGDIAVLDLLIASSLPRPAAQSIELTLASITRLLRGLLGLEWQPDMARAPTSGLDCHSSSSFSPSPGLFSRSKCLGSAR